MRNHINKIVLIKNGRQLKIMKKEYTIKWFKIKCSFYQQEFGIKHWEDVVAFVDKHRCFDIEIKG